MIAKSENSSARSEALMKVMRRAVAPTCVDQVLLQMYMPVKEPIVEQSPLLDGAGVAHRVSLAHR